MIELTFWGSTDTRNMNEHLTLKRCIMLMTMGHIFIVVVLKIDR